MICGQSHNKNEGNNTTQNKVSNKEYSDSIKCYVLEGFNVK